MTNYSNSTIRPVVQRIAGSLYRGLILLAVGWTISGVARGQNYTLQTGSPTFNTSLPVEMGYLNAANGNLHLDIPLGSFPQRGSRPFVAELAYDSRIWQVVGSNWSPSNVPGLPGGGWRYSTNVDPGTVSYSASTVSCLIGGFLNGHWYPDYTIRSNFNWTDPSGTPHVFPATTFQPVPGTPCSSPTNIPNSSAYATDSTGLLMVVTNYTTATIYAPDGTQLSPFVEDTNGNYFSTDSNGNVKDTLGRVPVTKTINCNNNSSLICYDVLNSQGSTSRYIVTTTSVAVHTAFGQSGITEWSGNLTVIQKITLPDGTFYQFGYDSYGEVNSVTLPTLGQVTYGYTNYQDSFGNKNHWVSSRVSGGGTWSYSPSVITTCASGQVNCQQKVTVTKPSGDNTVYTFTLNNGAWAGQVQSYTGAVSPSNLLSTLTQSWNLSNPCSPTPCTGNNNVQKVSETLTLPLPSGSSISKTTQYTYASVLNMNLSSIQEWNFYSGSQPTTPNRETDISYLTNYGRIINRPLSMTKCVPAGNPLSCTGSSNILAQGNFSYDATGSLVASNPATGIVNHDDTNYGIGNTVRGNLTQVHSCTAGPSCSSYLAQNRTYDTTGQIVSLTDPAGNTTTFSYSDNLYNDVGDGSSPATYSPSIPTNAYLKKITSASGPAGNLVITYGHYWGTGKTALTTDPNNQTTTAHFYDTLDRATSTLLPNGGWSALNYASTDTQVDSYTGITTAFSVPWSGCSSCRRVEVSFDSLSRMVHTYLMNDPDGQTTTDTTYDTNGRIQTVSNPYRSTSDPTYGLETPSYDGIDRRTQVTHADGNIAKVYYGVSVGTNGGAATQLCSSTTYGIGYPVLKLDETGRKRQIWRDGFGRIIEADEPNSSGGLNVQTCYAYDLNNNLTGTLSAGGNQLICNSSTFSRCYSYDLISRVTSKSTPEAGTTTYTYDSGGHLHTRVAPAPNQTGSTTVTTTYSYDALNRLTTIAYTGGTPTVQYGYDGSSLSGCTTTPPTITITNPLGHRTAMCDGSGATSWGYDAVGHIVTEGRTIAGLTKTISYTYNLDGSLKTLTYPGGRTITYTTGNAERPTSVVDTTNNINYATTTSGVATYSPPGDLANIVHGYVSGGFAGITESYTYNNRLQLGSIQANSSAQLALSFSFSYAQPTSNNGNVATQTNGVDSGRTQTYSYDNLNRVLTAQSSATSGADCWGLTFGTTSGVADDPLGNLTNAAVSKCTGWSLSVGVNSNNQIITPSGYSYDAAGNSTADGMYAYTYDAENRIITASGMSGGPYCYTYDGNGVREVKSNANGGNCTNSPTVDVLYWRSVTGDTIAETDGTGSTTNSNYHEYIFFAGRRIARSDPSSGNVYYFFVDQLGSTRTVTQANGTVCFSADYYPYGNEVDYTTTCPQSYKFSGYERDAETGLDYAFARYYNSRMGRFMSADPLAGAIGDPQSHNGYSYVLNNSPNLIDPFGMQGHCRQARGCPYSSAGVGGGGDCSLDGITVDCSFVFSLPGEAFTGPDGGPGLVSAGGGTDGAPASFWLWTPSGTVISDAGTTTYAGYWSLLTVNCALPGGCAGGPSGDGPSGGGGQGNSTRRSRLNHAAATAVRNFLIGEGVAGGVGCVVGGLVAFGATAATETWPLAGATVPAGCVGGALIGATEAFPYMAIGMIVEFGIDAWHEW